jgi:FecR protein
MLTVAKVSCIAGLLLMGAGVCGRTSAYAQDAAWQVGKSWGDFWINAQVVSGTGNPTFGPGDNIRTGQNGGVLLVRGKESILISPNTEVAIPKNGGNSKNGDNEMSTTINQRTGSITLKVEPSDMKHFEVETPYLAASAKGANLRVVVDDNYARVHALRGEVEVSAFMIGQRVLIMTGQTAKTSIHAVDGLSLSGAGEFAEILHDTPRRSRVTPLDLSPVASSTAVQAPIAEQTSRPGQTHGAGQTFGTGQADARETKSAIETFLAPPERNVGAQGAKGAIEKFLASSGQEVDVRGIDVRGTKDAIKKIFVLAEQSADAEGEKAETKKSFALSENGFSAHDARPLGSIGQNGHEDVSQNSGLLQSWTIPIGIGVFVTIAAMIFGKNRKTDDRPFDYNY